MSRVDVQVLRLPHGDGLPLPRYQSAPGTLGAARRHWERVLADGRAVASRRSRSASSQRWR